MQQQASGELGIWMANYVRNLYTKNY